MARRCSYAARPAAAIDAGSSAESGRIPGAAVVKQSTSSVNWGGYVPGYFPDNVTNIRARGSDQVQMTITGPYSKQWFTYNELSQVTPMPPAWDTTGGANKSDCTHNVGDCLA